MSGDTSKNILEAQPLGCNGIREARWIVRVVACNCPSTTIFLAEREGSLHLVVAVLFLSFQQLQVALEVHLVNLQRRHVRA